MTKILLVDDSKFLRLATDGELALAGWSVPILEKSELGLDQGCDSFLAALAGIVKKLNLQVPELAK